MSVYSMKKVCYRISPYLAISLVRKASEKVSLTAAPKCLYRVSNKISCFLYQRPLSDACYESRGCMSASRNINYLL